MADNEQTENGDASGSDMELEEGVNPTQQEIDNDQEIERIFELECDVMYADLRSSAAFAEDLMSRSGEAGIATTAQAELKDLESLRYDFATKNARLAVLTKNHGSEEQVVSVDTKRSNFLFLFRKTRNNLLALASSDSDINVSETSTSKSNFKNLKIPKVEIPPFSGSLAAWSSFRELYTSLIHNNNELEKDTKHHYLRSLLVGEPLVLIQNYKLVAENYDKAWNTILKHYDDPFRQSNEHFNALMKFQSTTKGSSALKETITFFREHLAGLQTVYQENPSIDALGQCMIFWFLSKCDKVTRSEWEAELSRRKKFQDFNEFLEFMEGRYAAAERAAIGDTSSSSQVKTRPVRGIALAARRTNEGAVNTKFCYYCRKKDHYIPACPSYRALSGDDRYAFAKKRRLCQHCLRSDCRPSRCSKFHCKICKGEHNTLIHVNRRNYNTSEIKSTSGKFDLKVNLINNLDNSEFKNDSICTDLISASKANYLTITKGNVYNTIGYSQVLLSTATIKVFSNSYHAARALLDQGSQFNFISRNLASKLNLQTSPAKILISGINAINTPIHEQVNLEIRSNHTTYGKKIHCLVLDNITDQLPAQFFSIENWNIPSNFALADLSFNIPGNIDVLLGGEIFWDILGDRQIKLGNNLPILRESKLGWLVTGSIQIANKAGDRFLFFTQQMHQELMNSLERFWVAEGLNTDLDLKNADIAAEKIFKETTRRDDQGRFIVSLPFKDEPEKLGNSKNQAMNRFYSLENRFRREPKFKEQYVASINDFIAQGHMREIKITDAATPSYYIPHHAVIKNTSSSTKLRVVFDASMKTSTGVSLNDLLLVGPVIQQDLISILFRFRLHKLVFVADIKQMYRQIKIEKSDTPYQRIFWRESEYDPIKTYEIPVLLFGTAAAPFLATRCLKALADEISDESSQVKAALYNDFYVDDVLSGANSLEEALELQNQLQKKLSSAGFELSKWCANHPDMLKNIPIEKIESKFPLQFSDKKAIKTLGLLWLPTEDHFKIWLHVAHATEAKTKREVLSVIASIFDPMGFIGPVALYAKLIMQAIWQTKLNSNSLDWDENLPQDLLNRWIKFSSQLNKLNDISVPRYIFSNDKTISLEIHGFCDASEKGIGAVVYVRSITHNNCNVKLLCAKSKINSKPNFTIPRLELCGALLLSELVQKIKGIFSLSHEISIIRLWSDSMVALSWLRAPAHRWQTFVANRVQKIQDLTNDSFWDYVDTKTNPADILSRGCIPDELIGCEMWWNGPKWLSDTSEPWSREIKFCNVNKQVPEVRKIQNISVLVATTKNDIFDRFSKYNQAITVIAYIQRFVHNARPYCPRFLGELKFIEYNYALTTLVKIAQNECFAKEINALKRGRNLDVNSSLKALSPILDESQVLRVGGRLSNSDLPFEQKYPILLSPSHKFTELIIRHFHISHLHAGPQLLKSVLRRIYWIPRIHSAINHCITHCIQCIRQKANVKTQMMANLPKNRLTPCKPFTVTGVDYAGPVQLIEKRARSKVVHKAYIAVFVCFTTKALHLELVSDLAAETFIAALERFIGRRGIPSEIHSDNGTTFVGANSTMQKSKVLFEKECSAKIEKFAILKGINWHFIPPYAPHFGGLWEAGVKSVKHHLKRTLGNAALNFEQFSTILVQIEACLNSRPLTPESNDPNDVSALTPGHFLIGGPLTALPNKNLLEIPDNRLKYWEKIKKLQQSFWKRWSNEYLNTLQQRNKWRLEQEDILKNSLAIIKEDGMPPTKWALGRVQELHYGADKKIRVATLKTANGVVKRAISKLIVLPIDDKK